MNTMTWLQDGAAWAWHTSLAIAVPALILLALGRWRGFSARWRMLFAAALLMRLMLPFVPELPWHPAASFGQAMAGSSAPHPQVQVQVNDEVILSSPAETVAAPIAAAVRYEVSWRAIAAAVWAIGVFAVGSWLVGSHWLIRRWVTRRAVAPDAHVARLFQESCARMGLQRRIGLTEMPGIATAAVCGWLRPVVLVPVNLRQTHSDDEIRGILLHELAHVRRCDVLWSWLGLAACALHWFNPFAWLALRRFHADRELECDRMALEHLSAPQRRSYAPALFKTLQGPTLATSAALVPFFRHKHEIHNRILIIMKPSKSLAARLAALTIIPALSVLTLTTAGADDEKKPSEETPVKQRDGEGIKKGPRDGATRKVTTAVTVWDGQTVAMGGLIEVKKEGRRDGEVKKEGVPDGERKVKVVRDSEGEAKKDLPPPGTTLQEINSKIAALEAQRLALIARNYSGPYINADFLQVLRDLEEKEGGKVIRDGDADVPKKQKVLRDGEVKKEGPRDGEVKKDGPRDGELKKEGARDGDVKKEGPRDGEVKKEGPRDEEKKADAGRK